MYWYWVRPVSPADPDVLRYLEIEIGTLHGGQVGTQPGDDLIGGRPALRLGFQGDEVIAGVESRGPGSVAHAGDVRIRPDDLGHCRQMAPHRRRGNILRALGAARDRSRVLLWKEPLWDHHVQHSGDDQRAEEHAQRQELILQYPFQAPFVARQQPVEHAFEKQIEAAVLRLLTALEEARAHHRRQGQRDAPRDQNCHSDGDRELPQQPADNTAHQQKRDKHGDQRQADRDDCEADLARSLEGRIERAQTILNVADDVLQHDDGIVHHKADGDRQRHQR